MFPIPTVPDGRASLRPGTAALLSAPVRGRSKVERAAMFPIPTVPGERTSRRPGTTALRGRCFAAAPVPGHAKSVFGSGRADPTRSAVAVPAAGGLPAQPPRRLTPRLSAQKTLTN